MHSHFAYCSYYPILICLIVSFGAMYLFGLSINVITLLALVLSIGLVVDDAIIVMLEKFIAILRVVKTPNSAAIERKQRDYFRGDRYDNYSRCHLCAYWTYAQSNRQYFFVLLPSLW